MKYLKIFTFACVTTLAIMVCISVGTASAKLCKDLSCTGKWITPTTLLVSSPEVKLIASIGTVKCESHATLVHEGEKNGMLFGKITLLDWTNCKVCGTVETITNGTFEDEAIGAGNGKLYPLNTAVLLKNCPLGAECTASANGTTALTLDGGLINSAVNPALGLANTSVAMKGFGCGSSATWKAEKPYDVLLVEDSTGDYTSGQEIGQI